MSIDPKEGIHLALLLQRLPERGRIGLAVVAAHLALDHLRGLPDFARAREALDLARKWFDGERFDPDRFEEALHNKHNEGITICAYRAQSEDERAAWLILGDALAYIASLAYQAVGTDPTPAVSEVDERVVDEIEASLRVLSPAFMRTMAEAGKYLKKEPAASFAELTAKL